MGSLYCFENVISWIHYFAMWMVHEILHAMSESKEIKFCWGIHVSTETCGNILKIILSLNSDVHEATNPVIEGSWMWVFNFFHIFSNKKCSHEEFIFKGSVHWERLFLKLYFIFCCCYPIFLNNSFDYIIYLVNTDFIFTLNYINIEDN